MTQARKTLVSVADTPYYHCIGRCVRRAFLCGEDAVSGRSYEHRREWMQERLAVLSRMFAVELCAYALMSNHYHLVLKLCPERARDWSDEEVLERWTMLFSGPPLVQRHRKGEVLDKVETAALRDLTAEWRRRLADLSWYMRCLNEYIARRANAEDGVTGHFWEARFKSQALLDEVALLQGMVYVDLNPVRAAMATGIEDSAYTAARQRFRGLMGTAPRKEQDELPLLAAFRGPEPGNDPNALPFTLTDYLELVEVTGRRCVEGKRGFIATETPKLLSTLRIDPGIWVSRMRSAGGSAHRAIGSPEQLRRLRRAHAAAVAPRRLKGGGVVSDVAASRRCEYRTARCPQPRQRRSSAIPISLQKTRKIGLINEAQQRMHSAVANRGHAYAQNVRASRVITRWNSDPVDLAHPPKFLPVPNWGAN